MHATEYLRQPDAHQTGPVVVLAGPERYLKQSALEQLRTRILGSGEDDEMGFVRHPGATAELRDVSDDLHTISMFGESRLVLVEDAADFVTRHRTGLEKYLEKPARRGVLVLDVGAWPKNTRLYKLCDKIGLTLECTELKGGALAKWLRETAALDFGKKLAPDAAGLMSELAGNELGLLSQELGKLASYCGDRETITVEDVRALVGGWRMETTWVMLDAVRDGQLDVALSCLDKLLVAGEAPLKIMGGITFVFRKLAIATELSRQGYPLGQALKDAGVFGSGIRAAEAYLRRIGRPRAEQIYALLAGADQDLKGASSLPERTVLERLFIQLSHVESRPTRPAAAR